jgi:hypothetical protein
MTDKIIGAGILFSIFLAIYIIGGKEIGWKNISFIFIRSAAIILILCVAIALIVGDINFIDQ